MSVECVVAPELSIPHFSVPKGMALDLDRTLTRVSASNARIVATGAEFGITEDEIILAAQNCHNDGRNPLRYIQETLPEDDFMRFCERYIDRDYPEILYPDSAVLWDALRHTPALPNVGVTYGVNPLLQVLKVLGGGIKLYLEILDHTDKGPHIGAWQHGPHSTPSFLGRDENSRPVAVYHATSVELVDDNDASFQNLPAHYMGARLIRPGEKHKPGQDGPISEHLRNRVRTIGSLGELALPRGLLLAGCSPISLSQAEVSTPYSFKPAYAPGTEYPGILIDPSVPFTELKKTLDAFYS